jgi:hypothetical protein
MPLSIPSRPVLCACTVVAGVLASPAARAEDDQPFITLHTTELEEPGEAELENWFFFRSGHAGAAFADVENRNELEYGISENWQASLYLNYEWSRENPHPSGPASVTNDVSVATEFIWRALDIDSAPFGLAFYLEPQVGTQKRFIETKILLQKNFLGDRLRWVVNVIAQDEWDHAAAGSWSQSSQLEFNTGLAWQLSSAWNVALEFGNEREFDGEVLGTGARPVSNSFYLGPTFQYSVDPFQITFGMQTQLPIAGNPTHLPGSVVDGFTADAEHWRMALRVTSEL